MQILHLKKGMQIAMIQIADEYYVRIGSTLPVAPFIDVDQDVAEASHVDVYIMADSEDILTNPEYNLRDLNNFLYALLADELPENMMQSPLYN